jgi:1,2-diacylglycerol 3-beta-galactosyltransferase
MAHTGGGHLRAAEAVTEALRRRHGQAVTVEMVDALGDYAPFPFNRLAGFYPWWIDRATVTWDWGYKLTDGPFRARLLLRCFWPLIWPRVQRMLRGHPCDVIVSMHPLTNHYLVWALRRLDRAIPMVTLVTDPVSVHPFWLSPGVDRCLVGSGEAQRKAIACGLVAGQTRVTGLPVNPCFVDELMPKSDARQALGWSAERLAVLMVGGGEGMGRIYEMARAIDATCTDVELAVVAGRNQRLHERLVATDWRLPVHVYGFVHHTREMPHLMSAADLLITKAGPGTIHEAFLAGLPLILSNAVPGQEEGNVRLVVEGGAGVWAPDPSDAAALVRCWMEGDDGTLARMAACSHALARRGAADAVAGEIWQLALTNL